jgi:hypothetical protein
MNFRKLSKGAKATNLRGILLKAAAFAVVLALLLSVAACDPSTPGPGPGPSGTEKPQEEKRITLIDADGKTSYALVKAEGLPGAASEAVDLFAEKMAAQGTSFATDTSGNAEITVRLAADAGDAEGGVLTFEGFRIFAEDSGSIVIEGGNAESARRAVEYFATLLEGTGEKTLPDNYSYSFHPFMAADGFTVNGTPVSQFVIAKNASDSLQAIAADYVQKYIFTRTGEIPALKNASDIAEGSALLISFEQGPDGSTGYVTVGESGITVKGNAKIGYYRVFRDFFEEFVLGGASEKKEQPAAASAGAEFTKDYGTFITYEDYGAAGDGVTDDTTAIYDAHKAADKEGLPILTSESATYYIKAGKQAKITTPVDWSCTHFIIDDAGLKNISANLFSVPSTVKSGSVSKEVKKLSAGQDNIGTTLPTASILTITNSKVMQYIRKGANKDAGTAMKELILVDENGNVDPSTPIIWDYKSVTSASYKPANEDPLTLKGGIFTTIANTAKSEYNYHGRGIDIQRSQFTIEGLAHYVTGEGETGAPYNGFFMISNCCNITVKNCVLTPHKTYYTMGTGGVMTGMGSYDCQVTSTIGLKFLNVIQSRSINDQTYWGTFASNYSRNILFDGCVLGRFDAHKGVCNVTIRNCSLGHQGINLIGHGTALIENSSIYARTLVNLRDDYGSTWNGDLIIRNCTYYPFNGRAADAAIIGGFNTYDHDFGYTCYLPRHITIENLYINDSHASDPGLGPMLFEDINPFYCYEEYTGKYPLVMPESIKVTGVTSYSGMPLGVSSNTFMFAGVTIDTAG